MRVRVSLSHFLIRAGSFLQSLPILIMRPDDLVEFSRQHNAKTNTIESWANGELVDSGLTDEERDLLSAVPEMGGDLLLLGVGGGREAIPLAKMGFRVTGVDFVAAMIDRAKDNAVRRGVKLDGLVQEISKLDVSSGVYDIVWLSSATYSCVPRRERRVEMVRRIARALKPGGFFLFQFHRDLRATVSGSRMILSRIISICTLGNLGFEKGDMIWGNVEYLHAFASEDEVRSELEEGGLSVVRFQTELNPIRCGAICRKK